jgi:hypothetical protein
LRRGQTNAAKLLADIAGDDLLVVSLLIADANTSSGKTSGDLASKYYSTTSRHADLRSLSECLKDSFPLLHDLVEDYLKAKSSEEQYVAAQNIRLMQLQSPLAPFAARITKKSLGQAGRRTGMQILEHPISDAASSQQTIGKSVSSAAPTSYPWMKSTPGGVLGYICAQQNAVQSSRGATGGSLGPPGTLGLLAGDSIDDLVGGRMFPGMLTC